MSLWESFKKGVSRNLDVITHTVQTGHTPHGKFQGGMGGYNQPNITVKGDNNVITMSGKGGVDVKKQQPAKEAIQQEKPSLLRKFSDKTFHALGLGDKKQQPIVSAAVVKQYEKMTGKKVDIKALTAKINVQEQKQAIEHASKSFVEKSGTLNWIAEKLVASVDKWASTAKETPTPEAKVAPVQEVKEPAKEDLQTRLTKETSKLEHPWKQELIPRQDFKEVKAYEAQLKGIDTLMGEAKGNPDRMKALTELKAETEVTIKVIQKESMDAWKADPAGYSKQQAKDYVANSFNNDKPDSLLKGIKGADNITNPIKFIEDNKAAIIRNTPEAKQDHAAQLKADRAEAKATMEQTTHAFSEKFIDPDKRAAMADMSKKEAAAVLKTEKAEHKADPKAYAAKNADNYVANSQGISKEAAVKLTEGMDRKQLTENPKVFVETHDKAFAAKFHEFKFEFLPKEQFKQIASLLEYAGGEKAVDKMKTGEFLPEKKTQAVEMAMEKAKPHIEQWKADPKEWTKANSDNLLENTVGSKGKEALALHTPDAKEAMKPENMAALEAKFKENPGKFVEAGQQHVAENRSTHGIEMKQAARISDRENSIKDFFIASEQAKTQEKAPSLEAAKTKEPSKGPEL